jgi:hypothetical protein
MIVTKLPGFEALSVVSVEMMTHGVRQAIVYSILFVPP